MQIPHSVTDPIKGNVPEIQQIYMRVAVKVMPTIALCWPTTWKEDLIVCQQRLNHLTNIPLHDVAMWQMATEGQWNKKASGMQVHMKQSKGASLNSSSQNHFSETNRDQLPYLAFTFKKASQHIQELFFFGLSMTATTYHSEFSANSTASYFRFLLHIRKLQQSLANHLFKHHLLLPGLWINLLITSITHSCYWNFYLQASTHFLATAQNNHRNVTIHRHKKSGFC